MQPRDISARVVADVVASTPELLRSWRAHGFLEGLGERIGAGTFYSRAEVLRMALAVELARAGLGLKDAFDLVVTNPTDEITAALAGQGDPITFRPTGAQNPAHLAVAIKIVVDAAALVRQAGVRLDASIEAERRHARRLSFGLSPAASRCA